MCCMLGGNQSVVCWVATRAATSLKCCCCTCVLVQVAANTKGIQLVHELIAEHSLQVVQAYMGFIQANAGKNRSGFTGG